MTPPEYDPEAVREFSRLLRESLARSKRGEPRDEAAAARLSALKRQLSPDPTGFDPDDELPPTPTPEQLRNAMLLAAEQGDAATVDALAKRLAQNS